MTLIESQSSLLVALLFSALCALGGYLGCQVESHIPAMLGGPGYLRPGPLSALVAVAALIPGLLIARLVRRWGLLGALAVGGGLSLLKFAVDAQGIAHNLAIVEETLPPHMTRGMSLGASLPLAACSAALWFLIPALLAGVFAARVSKSPLSP